MGKNKKTQSNKQIENTNNMNNNEVVNVQNNSNSINQLQQMTASVNLVGISVGISQEAFQEYLFLKKENNELHLRILELSSNEKILNEMIKTRDMTIDELKKENEELKVKITMLENDMALLKNDITVLKQQNKTLENYVLKMENKELYEKFVIAIQDVNRYEELEKNVKNNTTSKNLKKLRNDRVSNCHYLNEEDDDVTLVDDKMSILYDKLNKMPIDIKNKFNKKYPNLISDIVGYIPSKKPVSSISIDNKNDIEEWWTD